MGIALRRLRAVLPDRARGCGYRRYRRSPGLGQPSCSTSDRADARTTATGKTMSRIASSLTPSDVGRLRVASETCAYRLLDEGKELRWWHPLISGTQETVFESQRFDSRIGDQRIENYRKMASRRTSSDGFRKKEETEQTSLIWPTGLPPSSRKGETLSGS